MRRLPPHLPHRPKKAPAAPRPAPGTLQPVRATATPASVRSIRIGVQGTAPMLRSELRVLTKPAVTC